jgi:hypothetical protein
LFDIRRRTSCERDRPRIVSRENIPVRVPPKHRPSDPVGPLKIRRVPHKRAQHDPKTGKPVTIEDMPNRLQIPF